MASHLICIQAKFVLQLSNTTMKNLIAYIGRKLEHLFSFFSKNFNVLFSFQFNPFFIQLCYFIILSLFGYLGLKVSKPRTPFKPSDFDLFYTSVSATTVSSMTALEMEIFSNFQLILITFLMFVGGEVFTSLLELVFSTLHFSQSIKSYQYSLKELNLVSNINHEVENNEHKESSIIDVPNPSSMVVLSFNDNSVKLKNNSLRYLSHVVLSYLIVVHFVGISLVTLYISYTPSVRHVLKNKGINIETFSLFTIVSTFASCGFVPTNENMIVFKKNSGLLLLILPFVYLGNTLYPLCLRLVLKGIKNVTKREEFSYLLKNSKEVIGYDHLLSSLHCYFLLVTVLGFNVIQFVLFCSMEWKSKNMEGLNVYEKVVASLFQVTNARHSGESVFDLSTISSAILVLFIVMMYLPPYTTFLPIRDQQNDTNKEEKNLVECLVFSQLSYLVIFIIMICITERKSLKEDPLNFNLLNITLEVISAYGNVGFSSGYSCARQLTPTGTCKDSWVGFSGRWSTKGKFILILVMFFGRLKKFNMKGGKAWKLS